MSENPVQPKEFDAVLGTQVPSPTDGAVLGGIEGIKHRLKSKKLKARIEALEQAISYEQEGLNLVIQALNDEDYTLAKTAYNLLKNIDSSNIISLLKSSNFYLASDFNVDYKNLQELLYAKKWKEADSETARLMLKLTNQKSQIGVKDIKLLPCIDLNTINNLWLDASNGHFGFSIQKDIYFKLGGTREYDESIWNKFGLQVGWKKRSFWLYERQIDFSINAPTGCLPRCYNSDNYSYIWGGFNGLGIIPLAWGGEMNGRWLTAFAYHLEECGI